MITTGIDTIREGVAEFAHRAGISQVEAACEICLVLANAIHGLEAGLPFADASNAAADAFAVRWGKVFE